MTNQETPTPASKPITHAFRLEVRDCDDGWVRAALNLGDDDEPIVMAVCNSAPFRQGDRVRKAFETLIQEIAREAVRTAFGDRVAETAVISTVPAEKH